MMRSDTLARVLAVAAIGSCSGPAVTAPPPRAPVVIKAAPSPPVTFAPKLNVLRNDARLGAANAFESKKDFASAVGALRAARPRDLAPAEACAWDYDEGRLALAAEDLPAAREAFARAAAPVCPLSGYAHLRASQALARLGHAAEAIAEASVVPEDLAARDEAVIVLAESYAQKGDRVGALPLWRAWLAKNPYGGRWVDTSLRIATALLDGVEGPPEPRAREAFDLATKVLVEAPKVASDVNAEAVRERAARLLRAGDPKFNGALTDEQRARQAAAWLDSGDAVQAFEVADKATLSKSDPSAACRAAITRAKAQPKLRGKAVSSPVGASASEAWTAAISACERDDLLPNALYAAAKARGSKDLKLALGWYGRIETAFASHRLADDARMRSAMLVGQATDEEGHEARAEQMRLTLPDAYPEGDMRTEALFRGALGPMARGDWASAAPVLDRIIAMTPDDRHWATAGRASYFRAIAAGKLGDAEGEKERLAGIVQTHPLAYYMLLAYARLSHLDAALASRVLSEAETREGSGRFPTHRLAALETKAAERAMRLLEVGEIQAAKREFLASGALRDDADPEVVWTIGAFYNEAGAPELGHAFARSRLTDYLAHYPRGAWRTPWEIAYPRAFAPLVDQACAENGLPRSLAWGIMREESSFMADVKSPANAYGLMQLIVPTAKWVAAGTPFGSDEASLKQPAVSIGLGTRLLAKLRTKHRHVALAIGAYNAGSGAIDRWMKARGAQDLDLFVELVPYDETRNYIKRVLSSQAAYAYLYDPGSLAESFDLPVRLSP